MIARRPFWLAFAAFVLLGAAWAVSLPVNGTYDESAHIARAYAVYRLQWRVGSGGPQVPAALLPSNPNCTWQPRPESRPASCQQWHDGDDLVPAPEGAARYPPVYYLLVGAPIGLAPERAGIIASRLLSVVGSALLLASAVGIAAALGRPMLAAATALATTPMVVNLTGAINPNGMEIAAAVLLFVALLAAVREPPGASANQGGRRTVLILAGLAGFLLLTLRHLGPLLLAVDLIAVAFVVGWRRILAELSAPDFRRLFGGSVAVGAVVAGLWLVAAGSPAAEVPQGPTLHLSAGEFVEGMTTFRIPFYVEQVVGRFSYGETRMSLWAIRFWYCLVAAVAVVALGRRTRRLAAGLAGLVVVSLGILVALELTFLPRGSWYAHGRYVLPVLVGVVLLAGWAASPIRWLVPAALVAATAPVQLYALARVIGRFQNGGEAGVATLGDGPWQPALGTIAPLACVLVAGVLLVGAVSDRLSS